MNKLFYSIFSTDLLPTVIVREMTMLMLMWSQNADLLTEVGQFIKWLKTFPPSMAFVIYRILTFWQLAQHDLLAFRFSTTTIANIDNIDAVDDKIPYSDDDSDDQMRYSVRCGGWQKSIPGGMFREGTLTNIITEYWWGLWSWINMMMMTMMIILECSVKAPLDKACKMRILARSGLWW